MTNINPQVRILEDIIRVENLPEQHRTSFLLIDRGTGEYYLDTYNPGPTRDQSGTPHRLYIGSLDEPLEEVSIELYESEYPSTGDAAKTDRGFGRTSPGGVSGYAKYAFIDRTGFTSELTAHFQAMSGILTHGTLETSEGIRRLELVSHKDYVPECDERCLTDLLLAELEPTLTPLMERIGLRKVAHGGLSASDRFYLEERKIRAETATFVDPNEMLAYENPEDGVLIDLQRYPRSGPYTSFPCSRQFLTTLRYDLSGHAQITAEQALRFIPPRDSLSGLVTALRNLLGTGNIYVSPATSLSSVCQDVFNSRNPNLPETARPGQLFFTFIIEYLLNGTGPLGEEEKADAIRIINPTIAAVTNLAQIYVRGQIRTYEIQLESKNFTVSGATLIGAAILPARPT